MAYVKQNFVDGNVLYASELNHIEDGIADAALDDLSNVTNATVAGKIGTGAITTAKIADNAVSTLYTATIPANGWTGSGAPYTNTVSVVGLLASDTPIVDMIPSSTFSAAEAEIEAYGMIYRMVASNGSLTVYATDIPDVDINIQMRSVRK